MPGKNPPQTLNTGLLTMTLFSITTLIYFANAGYTYFYVRDFEMSDIGTNIALGIMWFCIGLISLTVDMKKPKK